MLALVFLSIKGSLLVVLHLSALDHHLSRLLP